MEAARSAAAVVAAKQQPIELRREAIRVVQLALGDVGPSESNPPMFDSYASTQPLYGS